MRPLLGAGFNEAAVVLEGAVDAPTLAEAVNRLLAVGMRKEVGHVESNAAGPDEGHALAHLHFARQDLVIRHRNRQVVAGDAGHAGPNASAPCHGFERVALVLGRAHIGGLKAGAEVNADAVAVQLVLVVAQGLGELFFARDLVGKQELAAEFFLGLVEVDRGAALGELQGGGHARWAATNHGVAAFEALWSRLGEFGFAAGARVDHASRHLALEGAVQARLVARDAGVDLAFPPSMALAMMSPSASQGRAMETRSAQPSASTCSATSGMLMRLVVTSGTPTWPMSFLVTQANPARGTMAAIVGMRASCQPMPVLMMSAPAASMTWACSTTSPQPLPSSTRSSMLRRYMMAKSGPQAWRMRETISSGKRTRLAKSPPQVGPVVGSAHQKLVDEVAFGAHDLDAIVASFTGQHGAADVGADGPFHAPSTERPRAELADGRLALGGRDAERMVAVAPAVQNLQGNAAIGCVDSIGHLAVLGRLAGTHEGSRRGGELACAVGADAACDDEPSATLGPLGIELGELGESARFSSSRPMCMEPMMERLGMVMPATSSGCNKWGYFGCRGAVPVMTPSSDNLGRAKPRSVSILNTPLRHTKCGRLSRRTSLAKHPQ